MKGSEIPSNFFRMIANRKVPEAEQELEKTRVKLDKSKGDLGYLRALEGLVLTVKSGDKNLYLNKANLDQNSVKEIKRDLLVHASNELHDEYDRGYFCALVDYVKVLEDLKIWERTRPPEEKYEEEIGKGTDAAEA